MAMMHVEQIRSEETHTLRHLVLWPHLTSPEACVIDIDLRNDAMHFGVKHNDTIVAIGSFFQMDSPKIEASNPYRLRAMAVHPEHRGKNFGQALIHAACEELKQKKVDILWCDARIKAVSFYHRLGFHALPEVYEVPRIGPHQFMWKNLLS